MTNNAAEMIAQFQRAAHRLRSVLAAQFAEFELTEVRYSVLRILGESVPSGCTQSELAGRLDQSESSISTLIDRMRSDGLLYRLRSKTDRRKRLLLLTERGQRRFVHARDAHEKRMSALLCRLDSRQKEMLASLLRLLTGELSSELAQIQAGKGMAGAQPDARPDSENSFRGNSGRLPAA